LVPNQAISRKDGQSVVKLLKNGNWIDQPVEIGDADERNTEILE
jgi:hypothetical protein